MPPSSPRMFDSPFVIWLGFSFWEGCWWFPVFWQNEPMSMLSSLEVIVDLPLEIFGWCAFLVIYFFFFCRHLVICTDVVILQRFDIFSGIIITTITITITTILVCLRFFLCLVSCSRHIPPTSTIPMHCQYFHQHVWLGLRGSFRKDRCSLWLFLPDTCLCLLLQQKCASVAPVNPHLFRIVGYTTICQ